MSIDFHGTNRGVRLSLHASDIEAEGTCSKGTDPGDNWPCPPVAWLNWRDPIGGKAPSNEVSVFLTVEGIDKLQAKLTQLRGELVENDQAWKTQNCTTCEGKGYLPEGGVDGLECPDCG
jgi:hypothetical protein